MNVEQLVTLAREVENGDPIDWGMMQIKEEDAYHQMAQQVLEMMKSYTPSDRQAVSMAVITKLLVENFVLNYQLLTRP
jgi:hypothetical protein